MSVKNIDSIYRTWINLKSSSWQKARAHEGRGFQEVSVYIPAFKSAIHSRFACWLVHVKKKKKRQLLWHIFDRWHILVCSEVFAALLRSIVRSDSVIYIICDWRHWIFQQNCTSESAVLLWSGAGAKPRMSVVANRYNTRSDCKIVSVVLLFYNSSINKKWTSSNWHFGHGTAKRCLLLLR